jgi:hypothetical protein
MKKLLLSLLSVSALSLAHATVTINIDIGVLTGPGGTPTMADGRLIQVIGSADNLFDAPTASLFTAGNDTLIHSASFDSTTIGTAGVMSIALSNITLATGTNILVRWFPTLLSSANTPGGGTAYGEYGYINDVSWVAPAQSNSVSLSLVTTSTGFGSAANSLGYASLTTAIPEPSTYAAIFGALVLGLAAYRRRFSRA